MKFTFFNEPKVQLAIMVSVLLLFILFIFFIDRQEDKIFENFCNSNYHEKIASCKRVKGWVVLKLLDGTTLEFGLYIPGENVSEQFAKEVEEGDTFIKNNSTSEVMIVKKSGLEKKWNLNCDYYK